MNSIKQEKTNSLDDLDIYTFLVDNIYFKQSDPIWLNRQRSIKKWLSKRMNRKNTYKIKLSKVRFHTQKRSSNGCFIKTTADFISADKLWYSH